MNYAQYRCPNCGGPLPPPPPAGVVRCGFCATPLAAATGQWRPTAPPASDEAPGDPDRPRLWVEDARYVVLGRLARGEGSDVFFARRDARVTELVVLKMLRAPSDADLLAREWTVLETLHKSPIQGTTHFARLLPQPVSHGLARIGKHGQDGERPVSVFRWKSGFVHTFDDVVTAFPGGVAPETSIWLWKRVLEQLGWLHQAGWVHGAVLPAHLLVHARDHGVVLVGWSRAVPRTPPTPLLAMSKDGRAYYPEDVWGGAPATAATDIAMSARCMRRVLGAPERVPAPLARLIEEHAQPGATDDAWGLRNKLDEVAKTVFGPPKYIPFPMPGWS